MLAGRRKKWFVELLAAREGDARERSLGRYEEMTSMVVAMVTAATAARLASR